MNTESTTLTSALRQILSDKEKQLKNNYMRITFKSFIAVNLLLVATNTAAWSLFSKTFGNYSECVTYVKENTNDEKLVMIGSHFGCKNNYLNGKPDNINDPKFGQCVIDNLREMVSQDKKIDYMLKCGDKAGYPRSTTLNFVDFFNGNHERKIQKLQEDMRRELEKKYGINSARPSSPPHMTCVPIGNMLDCR